MIKNIKKILIILNPDDKQSVFMLLSLMLFMAFMEVIGIVSIVPFLAVLGNQELIEANIYLAKAYQVFGFSDKRTFMMSLGFVALAFLLLTAVVRTAIQYLLARFSSKQIYSISFRLLKNYLQQPYCFFLTRNSSHMTRAMFSEVDEVIKQTFTPMLDLITYSMMTIVMAVFLIVINPKLALILLIVFGGFYGFMHLFLKQFLKRIGKERRKANGARFQIASEIFGGIKDLKVLGRENAYLSSFSKSSLLYARHQATAHIISQVPRYFIEVFVFGALLAIALSTLQNDSVNFGQTLPFLGLYGMAAIRLKPAMDRIYESLSKMSFGTASLNNVLKDLKTARLNQNLTMTNDGRKLKLKNEFILKDISFTYPNAITPVLKNINLKLRVNTTLGIIGSTGAGKSTLVDIILGLYQPDSGTILIDGMKLTDKDTRAWQNDIGYVPQYIFLADDSILSNIAFGIPKSDIDMKAIEHASHLAMLHEFISSLPDGYETHIGERGVRLSGGQRQRIGIARALYHNPDLLIFDEATSSLDNQTEGDVMMAIDGISGKKTIIMIAHRLSTLDKCDQVIKIDSGLLTIEKTKVY